MQLQLANIQKKHISLKMSYTTRFTSWNLQLIKKRMYNIMIKETNDGDWFKRLDEEVEQKIGMTPNAVASSFLQTSSTFKQSHLG